MKSYDVVGYVVDCDVVCVPCGQRGNGNILLEAEPVFAGSEWDYEPTCCECGDPLDVVVLETTDND